MQSAIKRNSIVDNSAVTGASLLVIVQVLIALVLLCSHFDLGLKKAICIIIPVAASTIVVSSANRAAKNGNLPRAYTILCFGIGFVMLTAMITFKGV